MIISVHWNELTQKKELFILKNEKHVKLNEKVRWKLKPKSIQARWIQLIHEGTEWRHDRFQYNEICYELKII